MPPHRLIFFLITVTNGLYGYGYMSVGQSCWVVFMEVRGEGGQFSPSMCGPSGIKLR